MITKTESGKSSARVSDKTEARAVTRGSGDVFLDLGIELSPEDRIKIVIAREITRVIVAKSYTQVQAAELMGTDQAKVSRISRGLLKEFSAERLMVYLLALRIDVNMNTSDAGDRVGRMTFTPLRVAAG